MVNRLSVETECGSTAQQYHEAVPGNCTLHEKGRSGSWTNSPRWPTEFETSRNSPKNSVNFNRLKPYPSTMRPTAAPRPDRRPCMPTIERPASLGTNLELIPPDCNLEGGNSRPCENPLASEQISDNNEHSDRGQQTSGNSTQSDQSAAAKTTSPRTNFFNVLVSLISI